MCIGKFTIAKTKRSNSIRSMYEKVGWYPVIIGCCWTVNYFVTIVDIHTSNSVVFGGMFAGTLNGLFTAIVFIINSEEARGRWTDFFFPKWRTISVMSEIPIDFEEEEVYDTASEEPGGGVVISSNNKRVLSTDSMISMNHSLINSAFVN